MAKPIQYTVDETFKYDFQLEVLNVKLKLLIPATASYVHKKGIYVEKIY